MAFSFRFKPLPVFLPENEQLAWLTNEERIERLDAIGETLLALLRQMTGKPDLKPSESEGLLREVKRLEEDPDRPNPPDEENPF